MESNKYPAFLVYQERRYRVMSRWTVPNYADGPDMLMYRLRPHSGADVTALAADCQPWKRGNVRHIKGTALHREKRPVHLDIDTGAEIIKARLKGKRTGYTCTFGGLYDLLARQQVINAKRDRAFAKRTGKKLPRKA
jgi:hypothetical protein